MIRLFTVVALAGALALAAVASAPGERGGFALEFDPERGTLTLEADDASLLEILGELQHRFGVEVVVPHLAERAVTASFERLPLAEALARILPEGARAFFATDAEFAIEGATGDQGEGAPFPPENPRKGEAPPPDLERVKPRPEIDPPPPSGDGLKPAPRARTRPGTGDQRPLKTRTAGKHTRVLLKAGATRWKASAVLPASGPLSRSGLVEGDLLYAAYVDGVPVEVGSAPFPFESRSYADEEAGEFGHIEQEQLIGDVIVSLALSDRFLSRATLRHTTLRLFRLPEACPDCKDLPGELSVRTLGKFARVSERLDAIGASQLAAVFKRLPELTEPEPSVTTLLRSGSDGQKKNLVVIGDGYQADDQAQFNADADALLAGGFGDVDAFREAKNAFNVFRINAISEDEGVTQVDEDGNVTVARDTALDYRFSGEWERCWMEKGPNTELLIAYYLALYAPQTDYLFIVLNQSGKGGCAGGSRLAVTSGNPSKEVAAHEMGHMVGTLGDEYDGGDATYTGAEPTRPNLTIDTASSTIKWAEFVHPATPLPTECSDVDDDIQDVGAFEGAALNKKRWAFGLWGPSCEGRMTSNSDPFNPVGYKKIRDLLDPYQDFDYFDSVVGDFDGDGRDDVAIQNANSLATYHGVGSKIEAVWVETGKIPGWEFTDGDRLLAGDFDGDGLDDLYVFNPSSWAIPYFAMLRSTGAGFERVKRYDLELPGWDDMRLHDRFHVADFDGDGKDDIVVANTQDWPVGYLELLRSTGTSLQYLKRYDGSLPGWGTMEQHDRFLVGDLDGDGLDDVYVANTEDFSIGYFELLRSTGSALAYVVRYDEELPGWDDMKPGDQAFVADHDADGDDDLYVFNGLDWAIAYLQLLRSDGDALANERRYDGVVPGWQLEPNDRFFVADVDGDGREDLYVFNGDDWAAKYLGVLRVRPPLRESPHSLQGSWQDESIGIWNLNSFDQFLVANFNGGAGWDDLFVRSTNWFGLLRSHKTSVSLNAIYPKWIHNHPYHEEGWW